MPFETFFINMRSTSHSFELSSNSSNRDWLCVVIDMWSNKTFWLSEIRNWFKIPLIIIVCSILTGKRRNRNFKSSWALKYCYSSGFCADHRFYCQIVITFRTEQNFYVCFVPGALFDYFHFIVSRFLSVSAILMMVGLPQDIVK